MRTDLVRSNLCPRQLAPSAAGRNKVTKTRGHPLKPSSKGRLVQLTIRAQLHLPLHTILRSEACNSSLSRSSCLGRLVSVVLSQPSRWSCLGRLVRVVLSRSSCLGCLVPVVLSRSSCLSRLVPVVLSQSSGRLVSPVSVVLSHRLISVLSQSSCPGRLVSVVLSQSSCLIVLSQSCLSRLVSVVSVVLSRSHLQSKRRCGSGAK